MMRNAFFDNCKVHISSILRFRRTWYIFFINKYQHLQHEGKTRIKITNFNRLPASIQILINLNIMSGFFGVVSKTDCVGDLFYGTDYHSHLGTRRGG